MIFRLAYEGTGSSGPLGVKALACHLNEHGHRTRRGARWGIGPLHSFLTSRTYMGEHRFNRKTWKTKEANPESEQIVVPVEPIIEPAVFNAVQARLKSRNPKVTPPRVVTGPILLTGIATCATCGGGMTLRTGKSGKYRYYTCATCAQRGKSAYPGRSIPVDKLDTLVTDRLNECLFTTDRVRALLTGLLARQIARSDDHNQRVAALQNKLSECESRLSRLYEAIENGVADCTDPTLKDRLANLKNERDRAKAARDRAMQELQPETRITEEKINAFAGLMRANVANGPIPFRRAYIRAVIDQVEVDDTEIRIRGRKDVLERLVMSSGTIPAGVRSFVRKWRTTIEQWRPVRRTGPPFWRVLCLLLLRGCAGGGTSRA